MAGASEQNHFRFSILRFLPTQLHLYGINLSYPILSYPKLIVNNNNIISYTLHSFLPRHDGAKFLLLKKSIFM